MIIGAIADDLTGATDLASTLRDNGLRVAQTVGLPGDGVSLPAVDAVVVALKSRSVEPQQAIDQSLRAVAWLHGNGARKIIFKYCSTFDSTDRGNIGPVADALLDQVGGRLVVHCPAFPKTGRTVYQGHLFVGPVLLSDSGMRNHPVTPMTDSNLLRVLGRQARGPVSLISLDVVSQGVAAIVDALEAAERAGTRHVIVDALTDAHLLDIGLATAQLPLVAGSSGIGLGIPRSLAETNVLQRHVDNTGIGRINGHGAILSGSCSSATLQQIAHFRAQAGSQSFKLDVRALLDGEDVVGRAMEWARPRLGQEAILIYASEAPEERMAVPHAYGGGSAATTIENALGRIAAALRDSGVRRFVVAGGETSGAVSHALGLGVLTIGPSVDPGVPWTWSTGEDPIAIALKSGNFGSVDFFTKAFGELP